MQLQREKYDNHVSRDKYDTRSRQHTRAVLERGTIPQRDTLEAEESAIFLSCYSSERIRKILDACVTEDSIADRKRTIDMFNRGECLLGK